MTRPWHRRRLRGARTVRRTSSAARLRAHLLALEAWEAAAGWVAVYSYGAHLSERRARRWLAREAVAASWAIGWAAAARRWG
jgi:hypothetical protein